MKEHPHQQLSRKRGLILRISYIIAIGLVILAFQWKGEVKERPLPADNQNELTFVDFVLRSQIKEEVPVLEENPIKDNPITEESNIIEVDNNTKVDNNPIIEPDLTPTADPGATPEKEEVVIDEVYRIVEEMPTFPGGMEAFYGYLSENITYPKLDRINTIEGTVHVQFVIEKDGAVNQIEILRGATPRMNQEAIRVLSAAPMWNPGKQQGQAVRVLYTLPIYFRLQ